MNAAAVEAEQFYDQYHHDPAYQQRVHDRFLELLEINPLFRQQVYAYLEIDELRAALARIGGLCRSDFKTGFHYELAVRSSVDSALHREPAA